VDRSAIQRQLAARSTAITSISIDLTPVPLPKVVDRSEIQRQIEACSTIITRCEPRAPV